MFRERESEERPLETQSYQTSSQGTTFLQNNFNNLSGSTKLAGIMPGINILIALGLRQSEVTIVNPQYNLYLLALTLCIDKVYTIY